jgi:hypothetical protein
VSRALDHKVAISLNTLAMESRRGDPSLSPVHFAVICDQSFAQDLHPALCSLLDEMLGLVDQGFVDKLRLIDENYVRRTQAIVSHSSIGLCKVFKQCDWICRLEKPPQQIKRQVHLQPRRKR